MQFLEEVKKIFKKKPQSVVGIDIGTSAIKVVEVGTRRGKKSVLRYGTLSLGPMLGSELGRAVRIPPQKQAEALSALFEATGITARVGGIAIPLKFSLIVTITVPAVVRNKLETVVPLEARKYIPVAPHEVNLAWSVISEEENKSLNSPATNSKPAQLKVLVAAIHNETIDGFQDIARRVSLENPLFEIETFSAMRSVAQAADDQIFALVDIGATSTKVVIVDHGAVVLSHTISYGSESVTDAIARALSLPFHDAEVVKRKYGASGNYQGVDLNQATRIPHEAMFMEVKKVIEEYEKKNNKKIQKAILIGGGALLKGVTDIAQSFFGIPVFLGAPFEYVDPPTEALRPILKESGPEFAVAMGIADRVFNEL